ncbi:MAG TPA: MFS transporter [Acidimicrobiia bacterium]|nr:MFS transporter [Acidimicrobiia bacterium]
MRDLLRIRDFRLLFAGQAMSNWGDGLTTLTLLILTQRLTGSVAAVAGTAIAVALPSLLLGMLAGVYVDRWDRRKVMIASDVVRGLLVLGFIFVGSADQIWLLYGIAFLQSAVGVFFNPAKGAIIPRIVGRERLLAANSLMETSRVVFSLLGTAAAGVWAGVGDVIWPIFVIDSATFVLSALFEKAIRTPAAPERQSEPARVLQEMMTGIRLATSNRTLVGILVGAGVLMFGLGAVNVLLVPFVVDDLGVSEAWFGALEGSQVVSMVVSGTLVAVLATRFRPTRLVSIALAGIGCVIAAVSLVTAPWQLMIALFAVGWFVTPLQASVSTLIQSEVADELRGRIGSALNTVIGSANVASMALAGGAAALIGTRGVFVISGALAVLAAFLAMWLFRGVVVSPPATDPAPA